MNPRTAPLVRVLGGLSLALLCVHTGLQQNASESEGAPPPTLDDFATVLEEAPAAAPRAKTLALTALPAPSALGSGFVSCGTSCAGVAAPVELSWGTGHVAAAPVSAPVMEEMPPARGADVAIAFAQAAVQSVAPAETPTERWWPTPPAVSPPPAPGWLAPVVSALFEPDPAQPLHTGSGHTQPTAPPPNGTSPMAVPLSADPTPEGFNPSTNPSGTPFKRTRQPGDKANGPAPAPLVAGPVAYPNQPAGGGQGNGGDHPEDNDDETPANTTPVNTTPVNTPDNGPGQASDHVPAWVPPVSGPGLGPVDNGPQPGVPAPWAPLVTAPLVDRVANPQPRAEDLLVPPLESVTSPLQAVVVAAVAEPGGLALLSLAALGLAGLQRRRARVRPQIAG